MIFSSKNSISLLSLDSELEESESCFCLVIKSFKLFRLELEWDSVVNEANKRSFSILKSSFSLVIGLSPSTRIDLVSSQFCSSVLKLLELAEFSMNLFFKCSPGLFDRIRLLFRDSLRVFVRLRRGFMFKKLEFTLRYCCICLWDTSLDLNRSK